MKLDYPKYPDAIKTAVQNKFGGIDRSFEASEGKLSEVLNTTALRYPRISSAPPRSTLKGAEEVFGYFDDLTQRWWEHQGGEGNYKDGNKKWIPSIEGVFDVADRVFYLIRSVDTAADLQTGGVGMLSISCAVYDPNMGEVVPSSRVAPYSGAGVRGVVFNRRLVVWIDGDESSANRDRVVAFEYCDPDYEGGMPWIERTDVSLEFGSAAGGVYHDIAEAATYIGCSVPLDGISVGDTVCILVNDVEEFVKIRSMYTTDAGVTVIETDYKERLPAVCATLGDLEQGMYGDDSAVEVSRPVPRLEHVCTNRDRIWGTNGNEIFACASCDANNWYNYQYNASDAFTAKIPAVSRFTAVCSYMGSVYFFTREGAYRMYGTTPEAFSISEISCHGCPEDNAETFAVAGGLAFYCSEQGPVCFDGEGSSLISYRFGDEIPVGKCALGAGGRYYLSDGEYIFVYDIYSRTWHRLSGEKVCSLLSIEGREALFCSDGRAQYLCASEGEERIEEDSYAEFGEFTEGCVYGLFPVAVTVRARLGRDSSLALSVSADGSGWQEILRITEKGESVRSAHFLPRTKAQSYRLRLDGHGEWQVMSIARSYVHAPRSQ